ncbi:MAG: malto-oligosyltrehalose synthase, partial [Alphaproteobacteria bacterium]|nr:malto-oligosyltrehalose synthase [Alphaproteobacteria bacterium]
TTHRLNQILDFVPNHMGVGGADNPLWLDVLEWGPDSAYAGWFDIDWDPDRRDLHRKVLVPALGEQYGVALRAGKLSLQFDASAGTFAVWAYDVHKLPICPLHYAHILGDADPDLERLSDAFSTLAEWRTGIVRRADAFKAALATVVRERVDAREAVDAALARLHGEVGKPESWRALDSLIGRQNWRLAHFRVAADDINYRRFFSINDLAGIRVEMPDVFDHTHHLVLRLLQDGTLDGLRIDHIDGLFDPKRYLEQLRERAGPTFYLVVEKILAADEPLREDWPIQGTTGYEFANLVLGWLLDPAGEDGLSRSYAAFAGVSESFKDIVHDCKMWIMANEMASELNALARDAARIARQNPCTADFTRNILQRAICDVVAAFPVYRTYIDAENRLDVEDRRSLDRAFDAARRNGADIEPSVFDFLSRLFSGDLVAEPRSGFSRQKVLRWAMKLQQYSGPVMAKGLEDTALYRYNRFVALNEVGGFPGRFGVATQALHSASLHATDRWPHSMLSTSTHDTKRGEDARARLAVLSEMPDEWGQRVQIWSDLLRDQRKSDETVAWDRNDEYMFYQMLIGSWPVALLEASTPDVQAIAEYATRIKAALTKSIREEKVHSTWARPDTVYEEAMLDFAGHALDPPRSRRFLAAFIPFAREIARLGAQNSLAQTVLKLTLPGVPDIYQGAELWDLSLVDPDNRRPVDYELRTRLLEDVEVALRSDRAAAMQAFMAGWADARFKLATILTLLRLRQEQTELFAEGDYLPLRLEGRDADSICAFLRRRGLTMMLVVAARFPARRERSVAAFDVVLPSLALPADGWSDVLTGRTVEGVAEGLHLARVLDTLPAAVLLRSTR